jgi:hypothetical protein
VQLLHLGEPFDPGLIRGLHRGGDGLDGGHVGAQVLHVLGERGQRTLRLAELTAHARDEVVDLFTHGGDVGAHLIQRLRLLLLGPPPL